MHNASSENLSHFTGLNKTMLEGAQYAILPGDPTRAKNLSYELDSKAKFVQSRRQHSSYLINFHGQKVLIISTGMGCPAIAVTAEELALFGIKYFIRLGTSGTIQEHINLGDIVISKAAVKLDGTSEQYAPLTYPAVASFSLTQSFADGAKIKNIPYHIGITVSSDTFWPGQERYDNYSGNILRSFKGSIDEWRSLNISNFEMEASALLTVCSVFNLKAACFCGIIAKRTDSEEVNPEGKKIAQKNWIVTLKSGLFVDMKKRNLID
ncbi:MAG: uridine phosphorylase [bacterium]|nr:uridine phosphorylase [bacterium]